MILSFVLHFNADPKQGNAYNNSGEKVSVNYSRMIFDLKVYDSCRLPTFYSADKHRQTAFFNILFKRAISNGADKQYLSLSTHFKKVSLQ